jgi:prepilin-type processing-associated H-X9-DG protein/prepilin-type N-terminal cleavage/methylation domain-containing protein
MNAPRPDSRAFTFIELLAVVLVIALLSALILPALSAAKQKSQRTVCLNNLKQLQFAWQSYADEHDDRLVPDTSRSTSGLIQQSVAPAWVLGNAKHDRSTSNLEAGLLYPHVNDTKVYRCPADNAPIARLSPRRPRVRSYSRNSWLGIDIQGKGWIATTASPGLSGIATRHTALRTPGPAQTFVFLDEHEDSIDDGSCAIPELGRLNWMELPADRHDRGCNLSFADSHVERWRWKAPKVFRDYQQPPLDELDRQDLERLQRCLPANK